MNRLPIIYYIRGYAGSTTGIDAQVDDPFYGSRNHPTAVHRGPAASGKGLRAWANWNTDIPGAIDDYELQRRQDLIGTNSIGVLDAHQSVALRSDLRHTGVRDAPPLGGPRSARAHTGAVTRFPLGMADVDNQWYLVSMLGENCNWVKNVRAAGGRATLRRRRAPVPIARGSG